MQFRASSVLHSAAVVSAAAFFGLYFAACSQTVSADDSSDEEAAVTSSSSKGKSDGSSSEKNKSSSSGKAKSSSSEKAMSSSSEKSSDSSNSKDDGLKESSSSIEADENIDEECVGEVGNPWDGTTAKEFACGAGTKLSPYIILTAEQLAHLSFIVGAKEESGSYYKLGADILLNEGEIIDEKGALVADSSKIHKWTSIGNSNVAFEGVFDGNGHTVSGMFINTTSSHNGLFGNVSGTVQNLTFVKSWVKGGKNTAGIVGYNAGSLSDLSNSAAVTATDECVGGVVGNSSQKSYRVASVIKNSKNDGIVVGSKGVGGVVGCATDVLFDGLENNGEIEGLAFVGGVIGHVNAHGDNDVKHLRNYGKISGTAFVGGVSGHCGGSPTYYTSGKQAEYYCTKSGYDCGIFSVAFNQGEVHGRDYVGGVLGMACNAQISILGNESDVEGEYGVGGVIGSVAFSTTSSMYNTGNIVGEDFVGGVFSYNKEGVTSSAYSTGKVDGDSLVGLMIGYNYNTTMADYYYLERGDQEPFGKNDGGGVATPKTEKEMKSDEFAELLGEDFVYDSGLNDGWLTLEWEE